MGLGGMEYPSEPREVLPKKVFKISLKNTHMFRIHTSFSHLFKKTKQAIFLICFENTHVCYKIKNLTYKLGLFIA